MSHVSQLTTDAYDGDAVVQLLDDGRRVRLVHDFGYVDGRGTRWDVPAGAVVDGASIPQTLWSVIGGPFEGKYRAASIVHDWFCDVRTRPWRAVHRMFYEAMLRSGVSANKARLMFGGVYWGGPRWSDTVVENAQLLVDRYKSSFSASNRTFHMHLMTDQDRPYRYDFTKKDLRDVTSATRDRRVTLDDIEVFVDQRTRLLTQIVM